MVISRANMGNLISPFGNAPLDANRKELPFAKSVITFDGTSTPVTSPIASTTAVTLNIPSNAVAIILSHDATAVTSVVTFNGGAGSFGLVANQTVTIPCADIAFTTFTINSGATTTNVYFAFELV